MAEARPRNSRSYTLPPLPYRGGLKIRIITYARRDQVFDLYNIAAAVFPGQKAAFERGGNYLDLCGGALPLSYVMTPSLTGGLQSTRGGRAGVPSDENHRPAYPTNPPICELSTGFNRVGQRSVPLKCREQAWRSSPEIHISSWSFPLHVQSL
jgi:hypothetical protein